MEVTWTYFWYISWSPTSLQPLNHLTPRIYDIGALTLLIRKILDFWSVVFLVFLACKHKKLLFQKWGDLVLYWIWSSLHIFLSLQPQKQTKNMKLLKHQKLDKIIFQQSENSVCTRNYSYSFLNNIRGKFTHWVLPRILLLWQNRVIWIPRKNLKFP